MRRLKTSQQNRIFGCQFKSGLTADKEIKNRNKQNKKRII
jgi:hypothetical protein